MKTIKSFGIALLLLLVSTTVSAQCTFRNTAFKSGEFLTYNLYYNWKFVWVKAGNASMSIVQTTRHGKPAYRGSLVTRGNKRVDDIFVLRDTLLCYSGTDLAPMYFRKGAHEGKRYTVDEVFYSYSGGRCHLKQHRQQHDKACSTQADNIFAFSMHPESSFFFRSRAFISAFFSRKRST